MFDRSKALVALTALLTTMNAGAWSHPTVWEPSSSSGRRSLSTQQPSQGQSQSSRSSPSTSKASSTSTYGAVGPIDELIVPGEGLKEIKTVSKEFLDQVRAGLRSLPAPVRTYLYEKGLRIYCHPFVADRPFVMQAKGKGWAKGFPRDWQYGELPGTFRGGAITLGEYKYMKDSGQIKPQGHMENCCRHECGHAIDHYYGDLSDKEEFKQAYEADMRKISPEQRSHVGYWLPDRHKGDIRDGRQEAFAEIVAAVYGSREDKDELKMFDVFPTCVNVLRKQMKEITGH